MPKDPPLHLPEGEAARQSAEYELRRNVSDDLERIADALEALVDMAQTGNAKKRAQILALDRAIVEITRGAIDHVPEAMRETVVKIGQIFQARADKAGELDS